MGREHAKPTDAELLAGVDLTVCPFVWRMWMDLNEAERRDLWLEVRRGTAGCPLCGYAAECQDCPGDDIEQSS